MKVVRCVKIYYDDKTNIFEEHLNMQKLRLHKGAQSFDIYYRMYEQVQINGKNVELFSAPLGLKHYKILSEDRSAVFDSIIKKLNHITLPEFSAEAQPIKTKFYQRNFKYSHPELDAVSDLQEISSDSIKDVVFNKANEKVQTFYCYYITAKVEGKNTFILSMPQNVRTYLLGNNPNAINGTITYTTPSSRLSFASEGDIIISPSDIDKTGHVDSKKFGLY